MKYRICKRCVMDTSDPTITFDKNGFCNYCDEALKEKKLLPSSKEGNKKFKEMVQTLKEEGKGRKYDCVIGVSGGVDSSYLAYLLSKEGLRILGIHIDGGWNTDISNKNVRLLSEKCGFDLEIIKINEKEMMDLQKAYFISGVVNQDVPQDHAFFAELYKYMEKHKIKYFISGHNWVSESITPKGWGYDAYDSDNIKDIHRKFGKIKLKTYPLLSFFEYKIAIPYFYKIKKLRPLNYINYDPNQALKILNKEIGFKYYGSKHCESSLTRLLQCYIQPEKYGFEKRRAHLSSLVVSGLITRDDALKELSKAPCSKKQIEEDINEFIDKLGLTRKQFDKIIKDKKNRSHYDFKTNQKKINMFNKLRKIIGK